MKSLKPTLLFLMMIFITSSVFAQTRILNEIFTDVNVQTNVQYAQNYSVFPPPTPPLTFTDLLMDVYTPDGDTATDRPLIILMHAGSFLPPSATGLPFGTKGDSCMVELSHRFAKRGWVAASASYRLGWNPFGTQEERTGTIINAVYRAMQDAKACVRYFRDNASTYGIDPDKIVLAGSNSGAYVALAAVTMDEVAKIEHPKFLDGDGNPFINQALTGDFDGFGGTAGVNHENHAGVSSDFAMALVLGGNVGDLSWVDPGQQPIVAFHGVVDPGSPFETGIVFVAATGDPVVEVSGAGHYMPLVNDYGNLDLIAGANFYQQGPANTDGIVYEGLYPFYGQGFEPWGWYSDSTGVNPNASKAKAMLYIDTIVDYFSPRAFRQLVDPTYTSVTELKIVEDVNINVYPNPIIARFTVQNHESAKKITVIELFDINARLVKTFPVEAGQTSYNLNIGNVPPGKYFIGIGLDNKQAGYIPVIVN